MMSQKKFYEELAKLVTERLPDYEVTLKEVPKMNGTKYVGIQIMEKGCCIAPIIYIERYFEHYQKGDALKEIANEIVELYFHGIESKREIQVSSIVDWEEVKGSIYIRVMSKKDNVGYPKDAVEEEIMDMKKVLYVFLSEEEKEICSYALSRKTVDGWNISIEELWEKARENTERLFPLQIQSISEVMARMGVNLPCNELGEEEFMYIAGNQKGINGATVFLYKNFWEKVCDKSGMDCDLYMLPSSCHEVIIIPDSPDKTPEALRQMVCDVNSNHVLQEDRLTNSVYHYSRENKTLEMVAGGEEEQ